MGVWGSARHNVHQSSGCVVSVDGTHTDIAEHECARTGILRLNQGAIHGLGVRVGVRVGVWVRVLEVAGE